MIDCVVNPLTNRIIKVGGNLYKKLVKDGVITKETETPAPSRVPKARKSDSHLSMTPSSASSRRSSYGSSILGSSSDSSRRSSYSSQSSVNRSLDFSPSPQRITPKREGTGRTITNRQFVFPKRQPASSPRRMTPKREGTGRKITERPFVFPKRN